MATKIWVGRIAGRDAGARAGHGPPLRPQHDWNQAELQGLPVGQAVIADEPALVVVTAEGDGTAIAAPRRPRQEDDAFRTTERLLGVVRPRPFVGTGRRISHVVRLVEDDEHPLPGAHQFEGAYQ